MNKTRIEKKTGDLYSSCFDILNDDQWHHQGELLAEQLGLNSNNTKNKVCFDDGCGHGALCYQLLELGAEKVIGFDLAPTPKQKKFTGKNIEFVQGSLSDIPLADNSFDLVVSSGVLHHTTDPEKCASELVRILKPGGQLVIGVYGKYGLFPWCLWIIRLLTVKLPVIPYKLTDRITKILKLNPIWRYQVLDYLYVPILKRYTPNLVKKSFFLDNGLINIKRVSNITKEKGDRFTKQNTSYSYDYKTLKSRILFGHGFIVIEGFKK